MNEEVNKLVNELKNTDYANCIYIKVLDKKNVAVIIEQKDLPLVNNKTKAKDHFDEYVPYFYSQCKDDFNDIVVHNYVYNYPDLSNTLRNYKINSLNLWNNTGLIRVKTNFESDESIEINKYISLCIVQLFMSRNTYTVEELYECFVIFFNVSKDFDINDFMDIYRKYIPRNKIIIKDLDAILLTLLKIPYINNKYRDLVIDALNSHDKELVSYLKTVISMYLMDIRIKENIAKVAKNINLDYVLDTLLFRETLIRKLQKNKYL